MSSDHKNKVNPLKEILHEVIFEADTKAGKIFDVMLIIFIAASVIVVMLETVPDYHEYKKTFLVLEWIFTIFFTIEYALRLYCVYKPIKYAKSFFGIVDLLSILPTYLDIFFVGSHSLMVIRALRLIRIFRIFKMVKFLQQGRVLTESLKASKQKIFVFLFFILLMVTILGSAMYLIEGNRNPSFDSIPRSVYWAIVTLTTVGYGDITPVTTIGQFLSAIIMIMGYSIIAVPTGILSAEMMNKSRSDKVIISTQSCRFCSKEGHDQDAKFCKFCGEILNEESD